jgi:hypothetical protein
MVWDIVTGCPNLARIANRIQCPVMPSKAGPVTVSACAYCNAAHTRNSQTCSESCARGYRRRGKQARSDVASGAPVVALGMGALLDLGVALAALEEARDLMPDEEECGLLNLFAKLPPAHRGVLVDGLRRAVARLSAPEATAAE